MYKSKNITASHDYTIHKYSTLNCNRKDAVPVGKHLVLWLLPDVMVSIPGEFCLSDLLHAKVTNVNTKNIEQTITLQATLSISCCQRTFKNRPLHVNIVIGNFVMMHEHECTSSIIYYSKSCVHVIFVNLYPVFY